MISMGHRQDETPVVVVEKGGGVGAFLFGLAAGAALALLFAPQSGDETRRQLRDRGRRLREAAEGKIEGWQERLEEGYDDARSRIEEGFDSARRTLGETRAGARDALDAGKAAVHSAREELDRRLAESRGKRDKAETAETDSSA